MELVALVVVAVVVLVAGPLLALLAWTQSRRLERVVGELEARLARLERRAPAATPERSATETAAPAAPESPARVPGPTPAGAPRATPPRPAAEAPSPGRAMARVLDIETLIAGRWLNRVGIVALLLATAFFLKYAFDNQWVGPMGRVAIGLVAGTGLLMASGWLLRRGYRYFSEGITALGGGVLFLSLFAAWDYYRLIPQEAAFAGMAAVTAALATLALGRDSQRLAVLALTAGLSTPALLSTGKDQQVTLFAYLAVLAGCFLVIAWRKAWRWVAPVALAGVALYFFAWYEDFYSARKLGRTLAFATLFFAELAAFLALRGRSRAGLRGAEMLLVPANAAWYGIGLHLMLYREHRWGLTAAVLVLGALHLGATRFLAMRARQAAPVLRLLYAGLALTFATAAIPIRLEGEWITIAWALEGALLVWAGLRAASRPLRLAGLGLLVVAIGLLLTQWGATERLFLNERFASFAAVAGALGLSVYWARSRWAELDRAERGLFGVAAVAASVVAVWGLSEEVWQALGRQRGELDPRLARQVGLSLLWAVSAGLMILVGVRRAIRALRWQGLALLGITVVKVFTIDLSFLERAYRIASIFGLGVVLLLVSFWYQRSLSATRGPRGDDPSRGSEEAG